jgi:catalase
VELVAPTVGGIEDSDGKLTGTDQKIDGGPSVLYDAVALLLSEAAATRMADNPAARDFVADAFAHGKFIGYTAGALPLLEAACVTSRLDAGFTNLGAVDAAAFLDDCAGLRYWPRLGAGVG